MLSEYNYIYTTKKPTDEWEANEYTILNDQSGRGTVSADASQVTTQYLCEYKHLGKFLDTVMGKTCKVGAGLSRSASTPNFDESQGSLPEPHDTFANFYASSATFEKAGQPTKKDGPTTWNKAKVSVVFRPPMWNVIKDGVVPSEIYRFIEKKATGQADFQTSSATSFKFVTDPNHRLLQFSPGRMVPAARFSYTWKQIPVALRSDGKPNLTVVPNFFTLQSLVGSVNSVAFDGFPPGTLLFANWSQKLVLPQLSSDGFYYWDITYEFGNRDYGTSTLESGYNIGWNYVLDVLNDRWDLVTDTGTVGGRKQYQYADLTPLFIDRHLCNFAF